MIDSNGATWSHSDESLNKKNRSFKFTTGDVIICSVDTNSNVYY